MAGIAFVTLVDRGKRADSLERSRLFRHDQLLQRAGGGFPGLAQQGGGHRIEVCLVPSVLRHARGGIDGSGVFQLGLEVRNQVVRGFRLAKIELRSVLRPHRGQVGAKILLREDFLQRVASGAALFEEDSLSILDVFVRWGAELRHRGQEIGIRQLAHYILRNLVEFLVGPPVAGHFGVCEIRLWIVKPRD